MSPSSQRCADLPTRARSIVAAARSRRELDLPELDALLDCLNPVKFEAELYSAIGALGTCPLRVGAPVPEERDGRRPTLPSGGRLSRSYLKDVERFPAMTRDDEVRHARRMEFVTGRLAAAEYHTRAERALRRAEFEAVRAAFVERNLHLVVSHAYAYRTYGVPLDDLVQEGNAALIRACEKFDWRHEVRFKTYVAYWVRQAIERHLAGQKGAVRVPHHLQQKFRRLRRAGLLPRTGDQEPTVDQVARAFDINRDAAGHLLESSRPSFSLDQEMTPEGESYRDFLVEDWQPRDAEGERQLRGRLAQLLAELDERERAVLAMRFGLEGRPAATLEEVGRALHMSRERSRQIQQRALLKLRRAAADVHLEEYL